MPTTVDGVKIDEDSRTILQLLADHGQPLRTGTLRRALGVDVDNKQVLHRMDEHLIPGGLVEEVERRDGPGFDERVFVLTEDGYAALTEVEKYHNPVTRQELLDGFHRGREAIDEFHDRLEAVEQRLADTEENLEKAKSRMDSRHHRTQKRLDDVDDDVDRLRDRLERAERGLNHLHEQIEDVRDSVRSWVRETIVPDLKETIGAQQTQIDELESDCEKRGKELDKLSEDHDDLQDDVENHGTVLDNLRESTSFVWASSDD